MTEHKLAEILASLEHDQWMDWSKQLAKEEKLSDERLKRWKKYWVSYDKLPEEIKRSDRKYAKKVIKAMIDYNISQLDKR